MVNTSVIPLSVDGVRLDTLAWNIETLAGRIRFPGTRGENPIIPGADGSVFIPNQSYEDGTMTLQMWVQGCDADGAVPGGNRMTLFRQNLDALGMMFGVKHRLLDIRQTYPAGVIQYLGQVKDTIDFSAFAYNPMAKFAVEINLPSVFGQDVSTTDYTSATNLTNATTLTMATYNGLTAPIRDAILLLMGPFTNPRLTNPETGQWIQYNGTAAAGTNWRINAATWESRVGAGLTLGSADTAGTAMVSQTNVGGPGIGFISLSPRAGGPQLTLTGSGFGTATQLLARARRKFIL